MKLLSGFLLSSIFAFSVAANSKVIKIAYGDWAPWSGKKLKNYGITNDIVKTALESKGYKLEFSEMPWARCLKMVKSGKFHITTGWSKTPEREKDYVISKLSVQVQRLVLYRLAENKRSWTNINELKSMKFGGTRGYNYGPVFNEFIKVMENKYQISNSDELGFKKVIKKRIDYYPIDKEVGAILVKKMGIADKVEADPAPVNVKNGYALIYKKIDPQVIKDLNEAMKALQSHPTLGAHIK